MEETHAIFGILLISAIAATAYFVIEAGDTGAVPSQSYVACCCNILAHNYQYRVLVRDQIQMFAGDCKIACSHYDDSGKVFAQEGLCAQNP